MHGQKAQRCEEVNEHINQQKGIGFFLEQIFTEFLVRSYFNTSAHTCGTHQKSKQLPHNESSLFTSHFLFHFTRLIIPIPDLFFTNAIFESLSPFYYLLPSFEFLY